MSGGWRAAVERVLPERVRGRAGPALGRTMDRLAVPPSGLKAGRGVPRERADRAPAVLVLLLGAGPEAVERTVAALLEAGPAAGGPRPVLVLDGPHFAVARRAGLAVDHVVSAQQWQRLHPGLPYADHLAERLGQLRRDYATAHLVALPPTGIAGPGPDGASAAQRLGVLLRPVGPGRWRRLWQPVARRVESAVDRSSSGA